MLHKQKPLYILCSMRVHRSNCFTSAIHKGIFDALELVCCMLKHVSLNEPNN
jgi:hypothetical protein